MQVAQVKRADVVAVIGATGTVEPEDVVDVGAQVAGQISSFGADANGKPVDYGSVVEEGTVLAQIDDSLYAADVEAAEANLRSANANVLQMRAKLDQATRDWERAQEVGPSEALAPSAFDQYKANFEVAKADLALAEAAVAQAKASLNRARRTLSYCTIKSPVKGVIIDRRVTIGQTVVSSLNTPSLFLIAKDLRRVQVWVSVNEADIGSIQPGQPTTFTVDAFPGRTFQGRVGQVRLNATMTQNVVTYTVEVTTDNFDGKLLPYLTANVQFETGRRENVLTVPNAALRWTPRPDEIAPRFRSSRKSIAVSQAPAAPSHAAAEGAVQAHGTLWAQQGKYVRPLAVTVGLTDGSQTEVSGPDVVEGMAVVLGEASASTGAAGASPFTPRLRQPSSSGGQGRPSGGGP